MNIWDTFRSVVLFAMAVGLTVQFSADLSAQDRERDRGGRRGRGGGDFSADQIKSYIGGKDRNGDGTIQPDELTDRSRNYLNGLGINTSSSIKLSRIYKLIDKEKGVSTSTKTTTSKRGMVELKVPGFGNPDFDLESQKDDRVRDFTVTDAAAKNFSEDVNRQAEDAMGRYDRDSNGIIDREEMKRARWGSPSPQDSDLNKDGVLSLSELRQRYHGRELASNKKKADEKKVSSKEGANDRGRDRVGRAMSVSGRDRDSGRGRSSRFSSRNSSSSSSSSRRFSNSSSSRSKSSSSTSKSSSSNDRARYEKYVDELLDRYDKDKDGLLSRDEAKEMRTRPKREADKNKDDKLSREELIEFYLPKSEKAADSEKESGSKSTSSDRGSSRTSSRSSGGRTSSSFSKLDKNRDGKIHMHEFETDWDDKAVQDFRDKDRNDDGVISEEEWSGRSSSASRSSSRSSSSRSSGSSRSSSSRFRSGR